MKSSIYYWLAVVACIEFMVTDRLLPGFIMVCCIIVAVWKDDRLYPVSRTRQVYYRRARHTRHPEALWKA